MAKIIACKGHKSKSENDIWYFNVRIRSVREHSSIVHSNILDFYHKSLVSHIFIVTYSFSAIFWKFLDSYFWSSKTFVRTRLSGWIWTENRIRVSNFIRCLIKCRVESSEYSRNLLELNRIRNYKMADGFPNNVHVSRSTKVQYPH